MPVKSRASEGPCQYEVVGEVYAVLNCLLPFFTLYPRPVLCLLLFEKRVSTSDPFNPAASPLRLQPVLDHNSASSTLLMKRHVTRHSGVPSYVRSRSPPTSNCIVFDKRQKKKNNAKEPPKKKIYETLVKQPSFCFSPHNKKNEKRLKRAKRKGGGETMYWLARALCLETQATCLGPFGFNLYSIGSMGARHYLHTTTTTTTVTSSSLVEVYTNYTNSAVTFFSGGGFGGGGGAFGGGAYGNYTASNFSTPRIYNFRGINDTRHTTTTTIQTSHIATTRFSCQQQDQRHQQLTFTRNCSMCRQLEKEGSGAQLVPTEREVLPTNVKPLHYDLTLEPNFETFKFNGEETIDFEVKERTDFITLNSLEIDVKEAKVDDVPITDISYNTKKQTVTFKLPDHLVKNSTAQLHLKFVGELNDKMAGFYRSSYQDGEGGKTKYLATTQMEPTDCRRAFPSYDEPAAKAKFTIKLIADKDLVCLSNMDEKETELLEGHKKKVIFNTTPLMSTYLVAFIVGDLRYVENNSYRVPIKVYATPGSEHLGQYSADIAAKTLAFFDKKFDIPYPLPKCDMVAIHDFSAGAMENFGLITYRTVDLLIDPENTNVNTKQRVTEVVMHELAHQWFGNLVTMDFWDGLWLNEGFATWMSWYACDSLYPDWKVWESYVSDSLQHALTLDALRASHPIEVPVKRADEINQIFDAISYSKGSSLLKMISRWLGEDVFIKGVSNYLKKHKWGNTKTSDLWQALGEVSGKDVVTVMDIWTKNIGFPIVKVEESGDEIKVTQNRFLATGDVKPEEDKVIYPVFLGLKTSEGLDESLVLDERTKTFKLPGKKDGNDDFFKINGDQAGIYRTAYDPARWTKLGQAGVDGKLSVEDRVGLVADAGSLASSGFIKTSSLLDLVKSWSQESNYVVWDEILSRIGSMKAALMFEDEATNNALKTFTRDLIGAKLNEIGWEFKETDTFADQQLKSSLFASAANADDPKAVAYARDAFKKFVAGDKKAIHPNLRATIFNINAKEGDAATFDQLFAIYKNPQSVEEKIAALRAFGRFKKPEIMDKVAGLLLQSDVVKQQDIYIPMQGLRAHKEGVEKLWDWLTVNWDKVYQILPPGLSMLGSVVTLATSGFTKEEQKQRVEKFFSQKDTTGYNQGLAQSLDIISAKGKWAQRDSKLIYDWLAVHGYTK